MRDEKNHPIILSVSHLVRVPGFRNQAPSTKHQAPKTIFSILHSPFFILHSSFLKAEVAGGAQILVWQRDSLETNAPRHRAGQPVPRVVQSLRQSPDSPTLRTP